MLVFMSFLWINTENDLFVLFLFIFFVDLISQIDTTGYFLQGTLWQYESKTFSSEIANLHESKHHIHNLVSMKFNENMIQWKSYETILGPGWLNELCSWIT
jgi:hypothetical protein